MRRDAGRFGLGRRAVAIGLSAAVLALTGMRPAGAQMATDLGPIHSELWAKNVVLCATNPPEFVREASSAKYWEGDNFKWLVAECDAGGRPKKFLFDGFQLMGYNFKTRALLSLPPREPGTAEDWSTMLDLYLATAQNLSRCEGEAARRLREPDRKAKVILGVPYPDTRNKAFGPVGGKMLDLSVEADRVAALRWFIDEAIARWGKLEAEKKLDNARLTAFYWFMEGIPERDVSVVRAFCAYVHEKGYLTHWVPSRLVAKRPEPWHQWGLDNVAQQINYVNPDENGRPLAGFDDCTFIARKYGMNGVQLNFSNRVVSLNPRLWNWRQQALANLEAALRLDWKSFTSMNFFPGSEISQIAADPKSHDYYEALCRFVDGSLTYEEVDAMCDKLAEQMHAAGQLSDARYERIKKANREIVLIPALEKLGLMEKPFPPEPAK